MKNLKIGLIAIGLISTTFANAQEQDKNNKAFIKLDVNADGLISKAEFIETKEKAEAKRQEKGKKHKPMDVDKKFSELDTNGDGNIDRVEFDKAQKERAEKIKEKREKHFAKIDSDGNNLISKEEFDAHTDNVEAKRQEKNVDKKPIDAEKKFSKLDANNDGNIDKDEFLNRKKGKKSKGKKVK